jgi:hypothetical protein
MIPPPPLTENGRLALNRRDVQAALVGGILACCCVCPHSSVTHWEHEGRYAPLHERCAAHLVAEWRELIANDQVNMAAPAGRPLGAYARRAATRGVPEKQVFRTFSISLGSKYFVPGMPEGAPWVAVADMPNGIDLVTPCGMNEEHARRTNVFHRASTARGFTAGHLGLVPVGGWVVDPTGAVSDRWDAHELSSRVDSAKLAV